MRLGPVQCRQRPGPTRNIPPVGVLTVAVLTFQSSAEDLAAVGPLILHVALLVPTKHPRHLAPVGSHHVRHRENLWALRIH